MMQACGLAPQLQLLSIRNRRVSLEGPLTGCPHKFFRCIACQRTTFYLVAARLVQYSSQFYSLSRGRPLFAVRAGRTTHLGQMAIGHGRRITLALLNCHQGTSPPCEHRKLGSHRCTVK